MSISQKKVKKVKSIILKPERVSGNAGGSIVHKYLTFVEWSTAVAAKVTNSWVTIGLALCAVFTAYFFYYPSIGGDQDIWFHIRYGSHFAQNFTWNIDHGQFNWTKFNPDFRYVTWIGSSIIYIDYYLMSLFGLYLLQYIVVGSIVLCFVYFLRITEYRFDIASLLAIMGVLIVLNVKYIFIKPDMFSGLLFTVCCLIYYQVKETKNGKLFYIYPPLFLVWVNTHGGFIVGLFLISAAFGAELANALFFKKARLTQDQLLHFAISIAISYALMGINPLGYEYIIGIITRFFSSLMKEKQAIIFEYGSLWDSILFQSPSQRNRLAAGSMVFMLALFTAICIYLAVKKRFFDLPSVLLVAFFYVFGMSLIRASQYFPLIWFFAFFYLYKRFGDVKRKDIVNLISMVVISLLCVKIVYFALVDYDSLAWFGSNWKESYPVEEVEYVKKLKPFGNVWNDYLSGGYLLWALYPDYKVFIDPRYDVYMENFMPTIEEYKNQGGVESYAKRFPFKIAIVGFRRTKIINWFLEADWKIAFLGRNAVVLIHKSIISQLPKAVLAEGMNIRRFTDVSNPSVLRNLFNFYALSNPEFGREVVQIYRRNVRAMYRNRDKDINSMMHVIAQKEAGFRQKAYERVTSILDILKEETGRDGSDR